MSSNESRAFTHVFARNRKESKDDHRESKRVAEFLLETPIAQ